MTTVVYAIIALLGVVVFLLFGAQIELFRTVEQIRDYAGLIDRPEPVSLGAAVGTAPSDYGLPAYLDSAHRAVVLFLSDKCATCRSIAAALDGALPRGVVVVIDAGPNGTPDLTLAFQLDPERTVVDAGRTIMDALGLNITPLGVVVQDGRLVRASTLPSTRQLYTLIEATNTSIGSRARELSQNV
ncbi:hypothetical protein Caci_5694 [Catenulispora acidiphila DSM 44928]|uniref:Thioredoxin domain-containing protein n=1 Tax=Catenulispora acidiphila (strain DSM 44928 / JCM 14897 / NBRC 102108 / NRRL B-24433 / ID139908) TaxID=479433 RepID=C7QCA4_CATAD|nr:hypothetical protein [Catenulispora acidiphila]ACU74552.1 hypothetical protein Caci_5694 [Catenulispora acidiphila DSM 44928]